MVFPDPNVPNTHDPYFVWRDKFGLLIVIILLWFYVL